MHASTRAMIRAVPRIVPGVPPRAVPRPVARALAAAGLAAMLLGPAVAHAQAVAPVLAQVQAHTPRVVDTLRDLVNIESGSRDLAGLAKLAALIEARLKAAGMSTELVDPNPLVVKLHDAPAAVGKVVIGRLQGTGTKRILLMAHMDTVYPAGTLAKRPFRVEGNRAYGPGIADDKGGIAVILHTLEILRTIGHRDYKTLTVMINGDEEISTPGSRDLFTKIGAEHDVVISCEPTGTGKDAIALATSGIAAATLTVRGKSAHAGVAPQLGRNALMELSHQLLQTDGLSDPALGIKFNWTVARAGTTRNVIPDEASAAADVRVQRVADYDAIEKRFRERLNTQRVPDTTLEPGFERRRPPLEVTEASRAVARQAVAIYRELGRTLVWDESGSGGGTDAAFAAYSGKPAVVESFGLAGYGYHSSEEEYVELDSVTPRLYLLTRMVMELGK